MNKSFILTAILALAFGAAPCAAIAQSGNQSAATPMATATINPEATDQSMGGAATPTPATVDPTQTTTTGGAGNGIWGLVGLVGLLGLFGARRSTTTTYTGPP